MVAATGPDLIGDRDRSLILMGFAGAFRRSEVVALDVDDVETVREGLVVTLRRSKTDPEAAGRVIGIPYGSNPATCPVRTLDTWLQRARIGDGAVFRPVDRHGRVSSERFTPYGVNRVVKKLAARIGLYSKRYSAHSLRAGLATSAAEAGASKRAIMAQTGHRSLPQVRGYIREGSLFRENAAAAVGL